MKNKDWLRFIFGTVLSAIGLVILLVFQDRVTWASNPWWILILLSIVCTSIGLIAALYSIARPYRNDT